MNTATHPSMHRRNSGQILPMTLMALLLLASLVFFVFNTGEQVNRRKTVQDAADSAAISGANWMARSMNVIAMNNVEQSRLINLSATLDSLPLATQITYNELNALATGLQVQESLLPNTNDPQLGTSIVKIGMDDLLNNSSGKAHGPWNTPGLLVQVSRLAPLYGFLVTNNFDMASLTYWQNPAGGGPVPYGKLWIGAKALEEFNLAEYQTAGPLTQTTAWRFGQDVLMRQANTDVPQESGSAFLAPVLPQLPVIRGSPMDFMGPIMTGLPPDRIRGTASDEFQRGPYDLLFLWRIPLYDTSFARQGQTVGTGTYTPPARSAPVGGAGRPGLAPSPPGAGGGGWSGTQTIVASYPGPQIGWNPYGVYNWSLTVGGYSVPNSGMVNYCHNNIPDLPQGMIPQIPGGPPPTANFISRMQRLASTKLGYMWGTVPQPPPTAVGAQPTQLIHHPDWICDYNAAKSFATTPATASQVKYTAFWGARIRSSLPPAQWNLTPAGMDVKNQYGLYNYALGNSLANGAAPDKQNPTFLIRNGGGQLPMGWVDPATNPGLFGANLQNVSLGVWETDWTYQVAFDQDVGLPSPPASPPGVPAPPPPLQTVYVRDFFIMFGIDKGADDVIGNPANWAPGFQLATPGDANANVPDQAVRPPRPFELDLNGTGTDPFGRTDEPANYRAYPGARDYFYYLGVARESTSANLWPAKFLSGDPFGNLIGVAQAELFNNQSFDLWTQAWQAKLVPLSPAQDTADSIDDWSYWINRMQSANGSDFAAVGAYAPVNEADYNNVVSGLQKYPANLAGKVRAH